jgi:hypothetical protein
MTEKSKTPDPGFYPEMTHDEHLQLEAYSASRGSDIYSRTPAYCRHRIDHPEPRTPQSQAPLDLGTAWHVGILEPHTYENRVAPRPPATATARRTRMLGRPSWTQGMW